MNLATLADRPAVSRFPQRVRFNSERERVNITSKGATLREGNVTDLDTAIARVEGEHVEALRWFKDHAGQTASWNEIRAHADQGPRLVTQAKGIYKPRYTDFALSVRQTLDSPYADKEVVRR